MSDAAPPIELPPRELGRLEEVNEFIENCLTSLMRKEKLAVALETEDYIKKLLNFFRMCKDLENIEGLHQLYEIFKNIFLIKMHCLKFCSVAIQFSRLDI